MTIEIISNWIQEVFAPLGIGGSILNVIQVVTTAIGSTLFTSLVMLLIGLIVVRVVFKLL